MKSLTFAVGFAASLCILSGCATVAPYEREAFTRPDMQLTGASEDGAQTAHVMEIREGAAGGFGASGGGCGCN